MSIAVTVRERGRADAGFSLVEALVASVLTLVLLGAVLALVTPDIHLAMAQPAAMDMQQRARVVAATLATDLRAAGAGLDAGPLTGSLAGMLPPVIPRRLGLNAPDPPATVREDAVTIVAATGGARQAILLDPLDAAGVLNVGAAPNCPLAQPLCGFKTGMTLLVFESGGEFDLFRVISDAPTGLVSPLQMNPVHVYPAGTPVAEASVSIYHFDATSRQLRHSNGASASTPVVDDVVGVAFRYFGDPTPPDLPRPPPGTANCLYDAAGQKVAGLAVLPGDPASLVELPLALFSDGPWCGTGDNLYDVDLLRIRQVTIAIRVQAVSPGFRATGPAYVFDGPSRTALRSLPDYALSFSVAPPNMTGGR